MGLEYARLTDADLTGDIEHLITKIVAPYPNIPEHCPKWIGKGFRIDRNTQWGNSGRS